MLTVTSGVISWDHGEAARKMNRIVQLDFRGVCAAVRRKREHEGSRVS
jgi:hypothetical protein